MTASDFDRDRDVIFFADTREESIYAAFERDVTWTLAGVAPFRASREISGVPLLITDIHRQ